MKATDKAKVAVVSAACLVGLTIVLKNVLNIPAEVLSRDIVIYIIIYSGFLIVLNFQKEGAPKEATMSRRVCDSPWFWSAFIIGITLAIVAVYTFG